MYTNSESISILTCWLWTNSDFRVRNKSPQVVQDKYILLLGKWPLKLTCTCDWQGFGQFILKLSHLQRWVRSHPRKAKCESCLPKGLAGISVFYEPWDFPLGFWPIITLGMHQKNQTNTMLTIFLVQIRWI